VNVFFALQIKSGFFFFITAIPKRQPNKNVRNVAIHRSKIDTDAFDDDDKENGDKEEIGGEMMRHDEKHRRDHQWDKVFFLIHVFQEKITGEYHEKMAHG
jgi:hypothetical protein